MAAVVNMYKAAPFPLDELRLTAIVGARQLHCGQASHFIQVCLTWDEYTLDTCSTNIGMLLCMSAHPCWRHKSAYQSDADPAAQFQTPCHTLS